MKYGMNLLLWTGNLHEGLLPVLEALKKIGFDGVELPLFDPSADLRAWAQRLDDLGLERTAVTIRGVEDNPISPDAAVRQRGIEQNLRTVDLCASLGCQTLCGPYYAALGHFTGQGPTADEWKWAVEGMRAVAEHAGKAGITLAMEPLNRFEIYLLNGHVDAARMAKEVGHPSCGIMYDTFHANIEEKSVAGALEAVGEMLRHVHISENDRSTPGQGNVRWPETFAALSRIGYDGWLVVEAFGLALPEIAAATKIWRRMYDTELQLAEDALRFMHAMTKSPAS